MKFSTTKDFEKDLKHLKKKFQSLEEDLNTLKAYGIKLFHQGINAINIVQIPGFLNNQFTIYKVRTIACESLKNRGKQSRLRLIYAYNTENDESILIELYFKGEKENENKERIKAFLKFYEV